MMENRLKIERLENEFRLKRDLEHKQQDQYCICCYVRLNLQSIKIWGQSQGRG